MAEEEHGTALQFLARDLGYRSKKELLKTHAKSSSARQRSSADEVSPAKTRTIESLSAPGEEETSTPNVEKMSRLERLHYLLRKQSRWSSQRARFVLETGGVVEVDDRSTGTGAAVVLGRWGCCESLNPREAGCMILPQHTRRVAKCASCSQLFDIDANAYAELHGLPSNCLRHRSELTLDGPFGDGGVWPCCGARGLTDTKYERARVRLQRVHWGQSELGRVPREAPTHVLEMTNAYHATLQRDVLAAMRQVRDPTRGGAGAGEGEAPAGSAAQAVSAAEAGSRAALKVLRFLLRQYARQRARMHTLFRMPKWGCGAGYHVPCDPEWLAAEHACTLCGTDLQKVLSSRPTGAPTPHDGAATDGPPARPLSASPQRPRRDAHADSARARSKSPPGRRRQRQRRRRGRKGRDAEELRVPSAVLDPAEAWREWVGAISDFPAVPGAGFAGLRGAGVTGGTESDLKAGAMPEDVASPAAGVEGDADPVAWRRRLRSDQRKLHSWCRFHPGLFCTMARVRKLAAMGDPLPTPPSEPMPPRMLKEPVLPPGLVEPGPALGRPPCPPDVFAPQRPWAVVGRAVPRRLPRPAGPVSRVRPEYGFVPRALPRPCAPASCPPPPMVADPVEAVKGWETGDRLAAAPVWARAGCVRLFSASTLADLPYPSHARPPPPPPPAPRLADAEWMAPEAVAWAVGPSVAEGAGDRDDALRERSPCDGDQDGRDSDGNSEYTDASEGVSDEGEGLHADPGGDDGASDGYSEDARDLAGESEPTIARRARRLAPPLSRGPLHYFATEHRLSARLPASATPWLRPHELPRCRPAPLPAPDSAVGAAVRAWPPRRGPVVDAPPARLLWLHGRQAAPPPAPRFRAATHADPQRVPRPARAARPRQPRLAAAPPAVAAASPGSAFLLRPQGAAGHHAPEQSLGRAAAARVAGRASPVVFALCAPFAPCLPPEPAASAAGDALCRPPVPVVNPPAFPATRSVRAPRPLLPRGLTAPSPAASGIFAPAPVWPAPRRLAAPRLARTQPPPPPLRHDHPAQPVCTYHCLDRVYGAGRWSARARTALSPRQRRDYAIPGVDARRPPLAAREAWASGAGGPPPQPPTSGAYWAGPPPPPLPTATGGALPPTPEARQARRAALRLTLSAQSASGAARGQGREGWVRRRLEDSLDAAASPSAAAARAARAYTPARSTLDSRPRTATGPARSPAPPGSGGPRRPRSASHRRVRPAAPPRPSWNSRWDAEEGAGPEPEAPPVRRRVRVPSSPVQNRATPARLGGASLSPGAGASVTAAAAAGPVMTGDVFAPRARGAHAPVWLNWASPDEARVQRWHEEVSQMRVGWAGGKVPMAQQLAEDRVNGEGWEEARLARLEARARERQLRRR